MVKYFSNILVTRFYENWYRFEAIFLKLLLKYINDKLYEEDKGR